MSIGWIIQRTVLAWLSLAGLPDARAPPQPRYIFILSHHAAFEVSTTVDFFTSCGESPCSLPLPYPSFPSSAVGPSCLGAARFLQQRVICLCPLVQRTNFFCSHACCSRALPVSHQAAWTKRGNHLPPLLQAPKLLLQAWARGGAKITDDCLVVCSTETHVPGACDRLLPAQMRCLSELAKLRESRVLCRGLWRGATNWVAV
jgi:hypothetical protein